MHIWLVPCSVSTFVLLDRWHDTVVRHHIYLVYGTIEMASIKTCGRLPGRHAVSFSHLDLSLCISKFPGAKSRRADI